MPAMEESNVIRRVTNLRHLIMAHFRFVQR